MLNPCFLVFPHFQVVQSLRFQSKNYSELGSCPALSGGHRPLLARTIPGAAASSSEDGASRPVEEMVQTATGRIMVAREGDPRKPAIITYHDLALNYLSNFQVRMLSNYWGRKTLSHVR